MIELVEQFVKQTNFDVEIKQALEKDIIQISKKTDDEITAFGLYTNWTIDCSPSEFWFTSLLSGEGREDLDVEELYATGSWDGFDQGGDAQSRQITDGIYEQMWSALKAYDDDQREEFYGLLRARCAKILLNCLPFIKEHFTTTDSFFVSIAEHDEYHEAEERMFALMKAQ